MSKMNFNDYGRCMAKYNSWQNSVLFELCDQIGDAERHRDLGMFFGSIHNTLKHILHLDLRILNLLEEGEVGVFATKTITADDFATLASMRCEVDARISDFVESSDHSWQDYTIEMQGLDGVKRKFPRQLFLIQLFNHQTHHRSQITAELHKMGIDYGATDLPFTPDLPL